MYPGDRMITEHRGASDPIQDLRCDGVGMPQIVIDPQRVGIISPEFARERCLQAPDELGNPSLLCAKNSFVIDVGVANEYIVSELR